MRPTHILWADDEIELLKPHILFLKEKGYQISTSKSGDEVLNLIKKYDYDVLLLDENMPGISGIETLNRIKKIQANLPVVMITKSEEETIMEDAIGSKISDYLIKPVNPNQILSSLKKIFDNKRLVGERISSAYQQDFRNIGITLNERLDYADWVNVYKKLVYWELELDISKDESMLEIFKMQRAEANQLFCRFIENNYLRWLNGVDDNPPLLSHTLLKNRLAPMLSEEHESIFFILIDNLRYDQWKILEPIFNEYFRTDTEEIYYGILPTATQYARNAIFAGLLPSEIQKRFPNLWVEDEEDGGKNLHEEEFFAAQLKRWGKDMKFSYNKIVTLNAAEKLAEIIPNLAQNKLNIIVYNFVDMLSHARTEMEVIRELVNDDEAYRSITRSWFEHSPLHDIIKQIANKKGKLIITTDHGTIQVSNPIKVTGDKTTTTNLRYKQSRSMDYVKKEVFEVKNPLEAYLPRHHISSVFIFAKEDSFFTYPNNYHQYVNYYKNTFQHGGVSMEEMLIPYVTLSVK